MRRQLTAAGIALVVLILGQQAALLPAAETPRPRKVVLIAGPLDGSHPPGTHEYEKTVQLIKFCLDHAANVRGVRTEVHLGGWPRNPRTLEDADSIVLVTSGADRRREDHPLLTGERMKLLQRQMKRGCGLVLIHWTVFVPRGEAADRILEWVGGYFDYESGPQPRGWYSKIKTDRMRLSPADRSHPVCMGVAPFELQEELYYNIRFRPRDPRRTPILLATIPGEKGEQTVAWTVERADGGRGFAFTGGHFFAGWANDNFRRCLLQAVLWTAHAEVPEGGVRSRMPTPEQLSEVFPGEPVTLVAGRFGKALDARASAAVIPGDERYRWPPLTIECWARLHSSQQRNVLVSCDPETSAHHWEIFTQLGSGVFSATVNGVSPSTVISEANVCDDHWHYLAMTFDGKEVNLYVDGKLVHGQKVEPQAGLRDVPGPLRIGQASGSSPRAGCDGRIDEVRLSSTVRPITAVPEVELPRDERTVGLWRFDQAEGFQGDPDWTPPPVAGKAERWEKETDADWIDGRLRLMDTGPYLNHTVAYTHRGERARCYKGTAIRLGKDAAVLFDRAQLRLAAGWTGGFVQHSSTRFGLLNTPTPAGPVAFSTGSGPGWARPDDGKWDGAPPATAPLPRKWARFHGLYLHGDHVVVSYTVGDTIVHETYDAQTKDGVTLFRRTVEVGPSQTPLTMLAAELPSEPQKRTSSPLVLSQKGKDWTAVALTGEKGQADLRVKGERVEVRLPASAQTRRFAVLLISSKTAEPPSLKRLFAFSEAPVNLEQWRHPGPVRWTKPIVTVGQRAPDNAPFVIDTLTLPYDNPYRALMFVSGLDFLPSGELAVCTAHGDVWLVGGINEQLQHLTWKRFATGLYQPLGLKVAGGRIHVIERGQLTRLHDLDGNGEADFYESVSNDWYTGGGEHSFDTCLDTDEDGNFYFFKTGDTDTPTGGCLLRVSRDGQHREIFATGFRQPVGLAVSPNGVVTGADQEGNWMPATRIDVYRQGGFYGDMRAHHRRTAPTIYDPPLCWLPREADNSAGGQVWIPPGEMGPLGGHPLHLSFGRCRLLLLLPQVQENKHQGGAIDLGLFFLSGILCGRFHEEDHSLYVGGLRGWQTAARRDGCLQRVRYTGRPVALPTELAVEPRGIRLRFSQPLDPATAGDRSRYQVEQWGYRWTGEYGSKHYSLRRPGQEGHDPVAVDTVTVSDDGRTVVLGLARLAPVMQMKIRYDLKTQSGQPCLGTVYNTINWVPNR